MSSKAKLLWCTHRAKEETAKNTYKHQRSYLSSLVTSMVYMLSVVAKTAGRNLVASKYCYYLT